MRGAVLDLSLAHTYEEVVVVGAEDSLGNLFVHKSMEGSSGLFSERVVVGGDADLVSLSTRACDRGEGARHKRRQTAGSDPGGRGVGGAWWTCVWKSMNLAPWLLGM